MANDALSVNKILLDCRHTVRLHSLPTKARLTDTISRLAKSKVITIWPSIETTCCPVLESSRIKLDVTGWQLQEERENKNNSSMDT